MITYCMECQRRYTSVEHINYISREKQNVSRCQVGRGRSRICMEFNRDGNCQYFIAKVEFQTKESYINRTKDGSYASKKGGNK